MTYETKIFDSPWPDNDVTDEELVELYKKACERWLEKNKGKGTEVDIVKIWH